jgi:hypothetical protein
MYTISFWHLILFAFVTFLAYYLGKLDGKNLGVESVVAKLIANKFLKYKEKPNGDLEFVPHPDA